MRLAVAFAVAGCSAGPALGEAGSSSSEVAGSTSASMMMGTSTTAQVPTSEGEGTGAGSTDEGTEGGTSTGTTGEPETSPRYDEVRQKSAHNSFQRDEGLFDMLTVHRVRSLEFDIHVGKAFEEAIAGEWFVYHTDVVDDDTQCRTLSQCLAIVDALATVVPEHEVVTVWVDLKDGFADGHTPADLDARLVGALAERLFTPGELVAGCPGTTTVQAAVTTCGWPQLHALRGRVLVALTGGGLADYVGGEAAKRAAFVAPALAADELAAHPEAAFVNLAAGDVAVATAVRAAGLVSRVWVLDDEEAWAAAAAAGVHHLATNKINAWEDAWATTAGAGGWPFACIDECVAPAREAGAVLRVEVDSGDLWSASDEAVLLHWPIDGAVAVSGLLGAVSSHVEPFIKGCIGVRAGDAADAAYFAVCRPADDEPLRVQVRAAAGADSEAIELGEFAGLSYEVPAFARLERDADGLCARGFGSADGATWTEIAERCFAEPLTRVGVLASAHDAGPTSVRMFGLTATPGGPLLAADAAVVTLGAAVGSAVDEY